MPHDTPLISTIVGGLVLAFIFGVVAHRFKMPPLVGYLFAGILVGPHTPGFVADQSLAPELAEIGVILLMFGVGLHFSLKDLLSVRFIALPGAIVQIAVATLLGLGMGSLMGWSIAGGLVFGLALSVASTVVLLKALQERRIVESERGKIAVGWLIVEDLAMVLALVLIPALAKGPGDVSSHSDPLSVMIQNVLGVDLGVGGAIGLTLAKVALFVAVMLVFGRRLIPWILHRIAHTGSRELFRLGVLAIALGVAFGAAKLFGVSLALGAFFAGMVLSESELSNRAAQESLPLRDAFAVLFFVSVGMLFDPTIILSEPWLILGTIFIIVIGKSLAAFLIVLAFRKTVSTALTISASLAQIGEFSFILAELGVGLKILPEEGRDLILAGAIISIVLNPVMFYLCDRIRVWLEARLDPAPKAVPLPSENSETAAVVSDGRVSTGENNTDDAHVVTSAGADGDVARSTLTDHAVVVGYGRVGKILVSNLKAANIPLLVIEDSEQRVSELMALGVQVIGGNATSEKVLKLANLEAAKSIAVAIPNVFEAGNVVAMAHATKPGLLVLGRAHSDAEIEHLIKQGADTVIMGEREIANGMLNRLNQIHFA